MEQEKKALERARLTHSGVIDNRRLTTGNKRLAGILKPGMSVLDIGCGTGAITCGIAEAVGPAGKVVGVDNNPDWIAKAREQYANIPGLSFEVGDVYNLPFNGEFDVVTAARVLQWLAHPEKALVQMIRSARSGGTIHVLDYNHEKIEWRPPVPEAMAKFYEGFLQWRADAGMDNAIADHLVEMYANHGLTQIQVMDQHEITTKTDSDFKSQTAIWAGVADFKGAQMVQNGYLTETQRAEAEEQFRRWAAERGEYQAMYLLSVQGVKQ